MPIRRSQNWLPGIFNDFFTNDWIEKVNVTSPAINVLETETAFKVEVAACGMAKDDFNVRIDEDENLIISMEKMEEKKEEKNSHRYLRREFSYSNFHQTLILPDNADKDNITAQMENGVLHIEIPKLKEDETKKLQKIIEIK
ncbi:Spore protein SP21 [termite gut metagenome]|uniref:Spore protein SP21 n=1 Tax=termite gut metagenome TaxID=433724 RepID=A0A5J4S802_9ZZZZ